MAQLVHRVPAECCGSIYEEFVKVWLTLYKIIRLTSCTQPLLILTLELIIDLIISFAPHFSLYRWCRLKPYSKCSFSRKPLKEVEVDEVALPIIKVKGTLR